MTLDGLEQWVKAQGTKSDKVHFIRYADDFIITGSSKELLEDKIKPAIKTFLAMRGLTLSDEKTHITHIDKGFDFLGFNIRKYNGKLLIKPSNKSVKSFLTDIRDTIKSNKGAAAANLIRILNPKIRGWANYYRHAVSKQTFSYVDSHIFASIWQWCVRRHPEKGLRWVKNKYFKSIDNSNWAFAATHKQSNGERKTLNLIKAVHVPIRRHIKIRAEATPYNSEYDVYFKQRAKSIKRASVAGIHHKTFQTKYTSPGQPSHVKVAS